MSPRYDTWSLLRVSGALLIALVGLHLLGSFFFRPFFQRLDPTLYHYGRYAVDLAMLVAAIGHGLVGLSRVVEDQGISPRARVVVRATLVVLGLTLAYGAVLTLQRLST